MGVNEVPFIFVPKCRLFEHEKIVDFLKDIRLYLTSFTVAGVLELVFYMRGIYG